MFYQNAYKQIQMLVYRVPCTILDACLAFDYNMCAKLKYFVYSSSLVQANALKYVDRVSAWRKVDKQKHMIFLSTFLLQ